MALPPSNQVSRAQDDVEDFRDRHKQLESRWFWKYLNKKLLTVCDDYEDRDPSNKHEGKYWFCARLLVVGIVTALFLALFINSYLKSDTSVTKRVYPKNFRKERLFTYNVADERPANFNMELLQAGHANILCPCQNASVPFSMVTNLFFLTSAQSMDQKISNTSSFCYNAYQEFRFTNNTQMQYFNMDFIYQCENLLDSILDPTSLNPAFVTPFLMNEQVFRITTTSQMIGNIQLSLIFAGYSNGWTSSDYLVLAAVYDSLLTALRICMTSRNGTVGNEDFWISDQSFVSSEGLQWDFSFGVNMMWSNYYNACTPIFCDLTSPLPMSRRLYIDLAGFGGLVNFGVLLVQLIVWPLLCTLVECCTPSPSPSPSHHRQEAVSMTKQESKDPSTSEDNQSHVANTTIIKEFKTFSKKYTLTKKDSEEPSTSGQNQSMPEVDTNMRDMESRMVEKEPLFDGVSSVPNHNNFQVQSSIGRMATRKTTASKRPTTF